MSTTTRSAIVVILLALSAMSLTVINCSSEKPAEPVGGHNDIDTISVSTPVTQSPPLALIPLVGLPANNDSLYAIVLSGAAPSPVRSGASSASALASDTAFSLVFNTDSGAYLLSPLNPSDPGGGGNVQIVITDEATVVTEPITLFLDTLPEAPGEYLAIHSLLKQLLDHQLRLAGTTRDALRSATPATLPLEHISLFVAYDALDNPDNPNSLQAFVDGTAPLAGGAVDWALLDRLIALSGYRDYLTDYVSSLGAVPSPAFARAHSLSVRGALVRASAGACISPPDFGIASCGDLADRMKAQSEIDVAAQSAANKVKSDITANTLLLASLVPGASPVTTVIGGVLWVDAKIAEGQGGLYPSAFIDAATDWDLSVTQFNEDFIEPGRWTAFNVSATSKGWKLDKLVLEAILQALGAKGAYDDLGKVPPTLDEYIDGLDQTVKAAVVGPGTEHVVNELAGGSGVLEICPNTWTDINCANFDYSDVTLISGNLDIDEPNRTYAPLEVGTAAMKIATNGAFGGEQTGFAVNIETKGIEVHLDPFQADADTSESIEFTVRVENAENTFVTFTLENGGSLDFINQVATVTTPSSAWNPPLVLRATSLASTGLRANATTPVEDEAEIRYRESSVYITPDGICLRPDSPQTFEAVFPGGIIDSVRWETVPAGIGSFSGNQAVVTYTAPSTEEGQITIKATVKGSKVAYAGVDISGCRCYWTFEAFGSGYVYSESGEFTTVSTLGGLWVRLYRAEGDPPNGLISFIDYNATEPGVYAPAGFTFIDEAEGFAWGYDDTTVVKPQLIITDYVAGEFVKGTASGTLSQLRPPAYDYIQFTLTFRAEFDNAERDGCAP